MMGNIPMNDMNNRPINDKSKTSIYHTALSVKML